MTGRLQRHPCAVLIKAARHRHQTIANTIAPAIITDREAVAQV